MRVLLVKPLMYVDNIQPPLGLGYIASALKKRGIEVYIKDCEFTRVDAKGISQVVERVRPDVVGVQCYTYGIPIVREYLKNIKRTHPQVITAVGGPHPSTDPEHTFAYLSPYVDVVICGEGEEMFPALLTSSDFPYLNGKIYCAPFVKNLDSLDMPAWDILQPQRYPPSPHGAFYKNFPVAPIITSRGCPFDCVFCSASKVSGKKVRWRSVGNVVKEIKYLLSHHNIKEFHFLDDNFTLNREFVFDFCRQINREKFDVVFACPNGVRIDTLDEEILKEMKKAGFYSLSLGIESGSKRILKKIEKGVDLERVLNTIYLLNKVGIESVGFFIIGFPFETEEDIKETIYFACESGLKKANFMLYHPLPGTRLFTELSKNGDLYQKIDLEAISFSHPAIPIPGVSKKRLKSLQVEAFIKFYMRPRILTHIFSQVRSFAHFRYILLRVTRWLFKSWAKN